NGHTVFREDLEIVPKHLEDRLAEPPIFLVFADAPVCLGDRRYDARFPLRGQLRGRLADLVNARALRCQAREVRPETKHVREEIDAGLRRHFEVVRALDVCGDAKPVSMCELHDVRNEFRIESVAIVVSGTSAKLGVRSIFYSNDAKSGIERVTISLKRAGL